MNYTIKNKYMTVIISSLGGELQSIKNAEGTEFLWQGDALYWQGKAPNLFPYIARLTNGTYSLQGKMYHMDIHGFVKDLELKAVKKSDESISFSLTENPFTKEVYPYHFEFCIHYTLDKNSLIINYEVTNNDSKTMYFGIGGHPGFNVPLEKGLKFSDYYLEFSKQHSPNIVGMSSENFVTGVNTPFILKEDRYLEMKHEMFDKDAIVLENMDTQVTLKSDKGGNAVTLSYPHMKYLGLWHVPKTKAPYICIEPWSSLPSRQDIVEEFEKQSDLIFLPSGEPYNNPWVITIE